MQINPSTLSNISTTDTPSGSQRLPQKNLNQKDFLKLLTVQLTQQDPMKPADDTSFIGQMAQFASLQQASEMATDMTALKNSSDFASASSLLGRHVTIQPAKGDPVTGDVTGVDASDGTPQLIVNGKLFPLSQLRRIEPVPLPAA
jgi:flagellar basal-body rod modification protein FlgD